MSDFIAFSEDIEEGMEFLEHHGVLGQRWGHKNGPPYPLGLGKHSKREEQAAKAAGVKVGKSSGKGSIDKINKGSKPEVKIMKGGEQGKSKPKKEMTDEEKREAALKAVRDGDKKKITKYMDYLTTDELREAQARSQMKDSLSRKDPDELTKSDRDKIDAMLSGDKQKVREYADKMTTQELRDAMNKVNLMQELNYEPPPPSAMDKLDKFMTNVDRFRANTEKAIAAYNVAAKIYNSSPGHEGKWPIIGGGGDNKDKKEKSDQEKAIEALAKQMSNDFSKEAKKTMEQQAAEQLKRDKLAYKNQKELEKYADKMDNKYDKNKKHAPESNDQNGQGNQGNSNQPKPPAQQQQQSNNHSPSPSQQQQPNNSSPSPNQQSSQSNQSSNSGERPVREYRVSNDSHTKTLTFYATPGPKVNSAKFKYDKKEGEGEDAKYYYDDKSSKSNTKQSSSQEMTETQKKYFESERRKDEAYLKQMKTMSQKKVSDYDDVPSFDELFSDSYKESQRNMSFSKAMEEYDWQDSYDYYMRHSEV